MMQTPEQIAATSQEILSCIEVAGGRVDPQELIKELRATHGMDNVIEGLQRAIERGKITLDAEGMVVTIASALQSSPHSASRSAQYWRTNMNDENENIMRAIAQLQAEGKVRVIGETIIHHTAPEGTAERKFEAAGLVFAFTDQSPSYCAGFEAGMVWQRMQAGEAEIDLGFLEGFPVRHENLETFARMAAAAGYRMEHQSSGYEGWEQMRMVAAPKAKPSLVLLGEPT